MMLIYGTIAILKLRKERNIFEFFLFLCFVYWYAHSLDDICAIFSLVRCTVLLMQLDSIKYSFGRKFNKCLCLSVVSRQAAKKLELLQSRKSISAAILHLGSFCLTRVIKWCGLCCHYFTLVGYSLIVCQPKDRFDFHCRVQNLFNFFPFFSPFLSGISFWCHSWRIFAVFEWKLLSKTLQHQRVDFLLATQIQINIECEWC